MNDYQREQLDALTIVREGLARLSSPDLIRLKAEISAYIQFRQSVDRFLKRHFSELCTRICYQSHTSACCSKDGIITFFADTVVNALHAAPEQLDRLEIALNRTNDGHRCVYLTGDGCMWTVRPVVCAMFLCDKAEKTVFGADTSVKDAWQRMRQEEKRFKWPDRPVLFDHLEHVFMELGYRSSLMHLNFSPGLLRVKRKAGLM